MSDQPGDVLDEAAKLVDALFRRVGGAVRDATPAAGADADAGETSGDAWSRATAEPPRIATGAAECRDCPICRAIALHREAGGDVARHLRDAGRSLAAAAFDVAAALDRTTRHDRAPRDDRTARADRTARDDRTGSSGPAEASESSRAGRSDRSESPETGDPWSAATGGPIDIG